MRLACIAARSNGEGEHPPRILLDGRNGHFAGATREGLPLHSHVPYVALEIPVVADPLAWRVLPSKPRPRRAKERHRKKEIEFDMIGPPRALAGAREGLSQPLSTTSLTRSRSDGQHRRRHRMSANSNRANVIAMFTQRMASPAPAVIDS
jgi:hypothetical protein